MPAIVTVLGGISGAMGPLTLLGLQLPARTIAIVPTTRGMSILLNRMGSFSEK
jgi:hypothetical protein